MFPYVDPAVFECIELVAGISIGFDICPHKIYNVVVIL